MAEFITEHSSLKVIVRVALLPALALSTIAISTTPVEKMFIADLMVFVSVAVATDQRGGGAEKQRSSVYRTVTLHISLDCNFRGKNLESRS
jgi:hypothetical protein